MTWLAWRQFRTAAWIALGGLIVVGAVLAISGQTIVDAWNNSGAAACQGDCPRAIGSFISSVFGGADGALYQAASIVVYVIPPLIGIFWGAPLIARELESGTYRLAWTQSMSRTRWLATKLAIGGAVTAATAGLLSWGVTAWSHHIDHAKYFRILPVEFGARGIAPIGYALFAFALGVTLGMLIRRTVAAMGATLAVYILAVVSMPLWIRSHLMPASHAISPLDLSRVDNLLMTPGGKMKVVSGVVPDNAWTLINNTITPTGQIFTGPASQQYCANAGPDSCLQWLSTLGLRQDLTYQPASHFWPLQGIETGIFVAVAGALVGFCFWWIRRRLT